MLICVSKLCQNDRKILKCQFCLFLTILVIVGERFRDLDGPKAPDDLSSYAARLLKENFVVFQVEKISE